MRDGSTTRYELSFRPIDLGLNSFDTANAQVSFSFLVNEDDANYRAGWLEWTSGIGATKTPALFGTLVFSPTGP